MKNLELDQILIGTLILILVGMLSIGLDAAIGHKTVHHGEVIDKAYRAKTTKPHMQQVGKTIMTTTRTVPEKWIIMVKIKDGRIITAKSTPETYYEKEIGDEVEYKHWVGGLYGICYSTKVIK